MLAARCTQNAQGRRFQRPRFGAQFAQALIESMQTLHKNVNNYMMVITQKATRRKK